MSESLDWNIEKCKAYAEQLRDKTRANTAEHAAQAIEYLLKRDWAGLMRGVRVEGDTVVISVHYGNDAARQLCGALIEEMNK
jgi:hypothetical protein